MAQITKTVDRTLVNGSEVFVYTFNVSYSGLSQPAENGYLIDFFPTKVKFTLPQTGGQIQSITQTQVAGGTNVQFNFGNVSAGTSFSFTVVCSFGPGRVNNDTFTNAAELFADGVSVGTATAPTVSLVLTPQFNLAKSAVESNFINPNEVRTVYLTLLNTGDLGYTINNVVITDPLPTGLVPDLTFTPIGEDTPKDGYSDPATDGITGSWSGNTMNFTLPSYSGGNYRITFKVKAAPDVVPGQIISNIANWTISGVAQTPAAYTFRVFSPADAFAILKTATKNGYPGSPILYSVLFNNQDTIPHTNFILEDTLSSKVNITSVRVASSPVGIPSYDVLYSLRSAPTTFLTLVSGVSGNLNATNIPNIPANDGVAKIRLTAPTVNSGATSSAVLTLDGTINNTAVIGDTILNNALITASGGVSRSAIASTLVNGESDLAAVKTLFPNKQGYLPLDEITVTVTATASQSITRDPTLADLLPTGLIYEINSEYFEYRDNFNNVTYDSRNPGFPITIPSTEVLPNFAGTGNTLYRWKFANFTLPKNNTLSVKFKTIVAVNPPPSFINQAFVGNPGDNVASVTSAILDANDYDGDGITNEQISRSAVSAGFLTTSEFIINKLVQGSEDETFVTSGSTVAGGIADYQLLITNNQEIDLKDIEIIDILPFVGDKGVMLYNTPRGSQFEVYATGEVTAQVVNLIGQPVDPNPDITIEYSTSNDPIRFDQAGNPIGTGAWSTTPPADITTLRSIMVTTGARFVLKPYDRLIISIKANAPVGVNVGLTAYNSFAVRANKIVSGGTEPLLPTEPNKVPVRIVASTGGSISQFVWEDKNGNGLYDGVEPKVNGITVELYDENMNLISSTVTANNASNEPGYYEFSNLAAGNYYVKFIPIAPFTLTVQQAGAVNGSKPNQTTGLTNLITLAEDEKLTNINAGVVQPTASIGEFVWEDINGNGLFEPNEPKVNGVTVELYDENMVLVASTVTANNASNEPGYYEFKGLEPGSYYVKFIPPAPLTLTIQQAGALNGSKPNQTTGLTNLITVTGNEVVTNINAGVLAPCAPPTINATNKCVRVGETFNPLLGVTATDCQGNNITSSIIVVENTVNTEKVGVYSVTYSVTDSKDQTTTKSISVVVCQNSERNQAITDVIASIALQQAALAHILNAEGEKIQKAVQLGFADEDLAKINQSVTAMTKTITKLELILKSKLDLLCQSPCSGDCCDNLDL